MAVPHTRPIGLFAHANDPTLPPQIPLAPLKQLQARFNPLADWMMYLVIFAGGCFGRRAPRRTCSCAATCRRSGG